MHSFSYGAYIDTADNCNIVDNLGKLVALSRTVDFSC